MKISHGCWHHGEHIEIGYEYKFVLLFNMQMLMILEINGIYIGKKSVCLSVEADGKNVIGLLVVSVNGYQHVAGSARVGACQNNCLFMSITHFVMTLV